MAVQTGTTSTSVSWSAPTDNGRAAITNYRVVANPGGSTCQTSGAQCTLAGLEPQTLYTFAVQALNSAGWGAIGSASGRTTGANPSVSVASVGEPGDAVVVRGSGFTSRGDVVVGLNTPSGTPANRSLYPTSVVADSTGELSWILPGAAAEAPGTWFVQFVDVETQETAEVSFTISSQPATSECGTVFECLANDERYSGTTGREGFVVRLYAAVFLRLPDSDGFEYWVEHEWDGVSIAAYFANSAEFKARYGSLTDAEFVDLVYDNVLGRAGEQAGVNYWNGVLRTEPRSTVIVGFADSAEFRVKTTTG